MAFFSAFKRPFKRRFKDLLKAFKRPSKVLSKAFKGAQRSSREFQEVSGSLQRRSMELQGAQGSSREFQGAQRSSSGPKEFREKLRKSGNTEKP
jgi:hypothetical protein